jgi:hypothetical protein
MIESTIPREVTWDLPEGNYPAKLIRMKKEIKQSRQGPKEMVKFYFEVDVPSLPHLNCMAGRRFENSLNPGSDLRNWLEGLLGRQYFLNRSGQKIDLEALIETECEVALEHFFGRDYDTPHVTVARVVMPGNLKLTEGGKD